MVLIKPPLGYLKMEGFLASQGGGVIITTQFCWGYAGGWGAGARGALGPLTGLTGQKSFHFEVTEGGLY